MQTQQWLVATRNAGKLAEIRSIFKYPGIALLGVADVGDALPEVEEDGDTFEANAITKALTLALVSGLTTLADDSGLEVDALGGEPGVYSARYAGEPCDDEANNRKLLMRLKGVENRRARFRCVIALATPDGRVTTACGACEGGIAVAARGAGGFGYDPLFIPDGRSHTFAELGEAVKHRLSHRGTALRAAASAWRHPDGSLGFPVSRHETR